MADQLTIDLVFVANPNDALAALVDINDAAEVVTRTVNDAVGAAGDLSKELAGVEAPGLVAASEAVVAMGDADLSGLAGAAESLAGAAVPADDIAASLSEAQVAAEGLSVAAIDPAGAEAVAGALDEAVLAAEGLSVGLNDAFADAATEAGGLRGALADVLDFAADAADAVANVAEHLAGAADSAEEAADVVASLSSAADDNADAQDDAAEGAETTANNLGDVNDELKQSGPLAAYLKDQFVGIVDTSHAVIPNLGGITKGLFDAVKSLTGGGIMGTVGLGIAAGAAAALVAGEKYKSAMDIIVTTTGATGERLEGLRSSFDDVLGSSGRSATELATIFSQLTRDTGLTGDGLEKLTKDTAAFLKVTGGGVGDVRALTQAMKALGIEMSGAAKFQDEVTAAQKAFGGNIGSILSQIKTAGPALKTLGFDTGQIAGLVAQFDQAGLSVQRLIPSLTKLAREATQHGQTASSAFSDLTERITGAASVTAALDEVQGVFSGRMATQFVTAVRNGTISVDEINKAMANAPGLVSRLGSELGSLGGQLAIIRNQFTTALGPVGMELLTGLRGAVEDVKPSMKELADILKALAPAFKGFAEALFVPLEVLAKLSGPLDFLGDLLDRIPEPLLQMAGIFTALSIIPFGRIATGIADIAKSLATYASARAAMLTAGAVGTAKGGAAAGIEEAGSWAGSGLAGTGGAAAASGSAAAIPVAGLIIAGLTLAFVGLNTVMENNKKKQAELKAESEALGKALGDLSLISTEAAASFDKVASDPKGGIFDQEDLDRLNKARLTVGGLRTDVVGALQNPNADLGRATRESILAAYGGDIAEMLRVTEPGWAKEADRLSQNKTLAAEAARSYLEMGTVAGHHIEVLDQAAGLAEETKTFANEQARAQLNNLQTNQAITAEQRQQAVTALGLKTERGNEQAVLFKINEELHRQLLLKHGIAAVDLVTDERHAGFLKALGDQSLLEGDIAHASDLRVKSSQAMNEAMRDGVVTDKEWVVINDQMTEAGFDQEEMTKGLKTAHEELQAVQAKYPTNTAAVDAAVTRTAQLMGQGFDKASALSQAAAELGVTIDKVDGPFSNFEAKAKTLGPALQVTDAASASLQRSMEDGVLTYAEQADLLAATGNNADMAARALDTYNAGVEKTRTALDKLNPTMGETAAKLSDFTKLGFGPDMEAQNAAIEDSANTRKAAIDAEIAQLETLKSAEGADTGSLQARIDALKAQQDDIDGLTERAKATLQVYDDLAQQARAKGALLTSDIDSQTAKVTATRDAAAASAAASGRAFDPAAFDAQLADLQTRRDKAQTEMDATVARSQATSQQMLDAGANAVNGVLPLSETFQVLTDKYVAESTQFQGVAELRAQGLDDFLKVLFDPANAFSEAEIAARLKEAEEATPEQRTTIERNAESLAAAQKKALGDRDAVGDLFAQTNPKAVAGAEKLGTDTANSLTKGFLGAIEDGRFLELVQDLFSGQSPHDILEKYKPKGQAAAAGFLGSAEQQLLENPLPIETATTLTDDINRQLGVEGTAGGVNYAGDFDQHLLENPLPIETATSFTGPVTTQMSTEGEGGGFNWRSRVKGYIEENPLPSSTADAVVADVNGVEGGSTGLWVGGWAGGNLYGKGLSAGVQDYTTSGAAFSDAFILGETLINGGNTALGVHSPSVEGMKTGASWVEGIALGIENSTQRAVAAATAVGEAVAAVVLPIPAGIDSAAIAAATSAAAAARPLVGAGSLVGAQTGGQFSSTSAVEGSQGEQAPLMHIENVTVTGTTNATADEVAEAMSRKIGWLGITGRHEL